MRKNDIENIARILRKKALVRTGTIVGFENDGKVVQVRFHDTKLPEGQFERKLVCEGIIEGSTFTLIQPNFRRPVSDLIDVEKEVGAGSFKGLTLPLVGFETYPEGSENPDCIIGLFELPGGSIYKEVLTETRHDIIIPGYGTFPSQKVIGEDTFIRTVLRPWYGPYKVGSGRKIVSIGQGPILFTPSGSTEQREGIPFIDKLMTFVAANELEDSSYYKRLDGTLARYKSGVVGFGEAHDSIFSTFYHDRDRSYVLFCEGVTFFEYFKKFMQHYAYYQRGLPYAGKPHGANRFLYLVNENDVYMSNTYANKWLGTEYVYESLNNLLNAASPEIEGAFIVNSIQYDLNLNAVKLQGETRWFEETLGIDEFRDFIGNNCTRITPVVRNATTPGQIVKVGLDGRYWGVLTDIYPEEYMASEHEPGEPQKVRTFVCHIPESKPFECDIGIRLRQVTITRPSLWFPDRHYGDYRSMNFPFAFDTQETQIQLCDGRFTPYFVLDIPQNMSEFMVDGGLIYHWNRDRTMRRTAYAIPHMTYPESKIIHSFLTPDEFTESSLPLKEEIALNLSNIGLAEYDNYLVEENSSYMNFAANLVSYNVAENGYSSEEVMEFAGTKEQVRDLLSGYYFDAVIDKNAISFKDWELNFALVIGFSDMNRKVLTKEVHRAFVKGIWAQFELDEGKPYEVQDLNFKDPRITTLISYGEQQYPELGGNPANGADAPYNTYKITTPLYDTGLNGLNRWAPDSTATEIESVEIYRMTGAYYEPSWNFYTGRWLWEWESEPCRMVTAEDLELVSPYPGVRVPIIASDWGEVGGKWHLPRLKINYRKLKGGTTPSFYVRYRDLVEMYAECSLEDAVDAHYGDYYRDHIDGTYYGIMVPVIDPIYGPIEFPECDDELCNSIRFQEGIVAINAVRGFVSRKKYKRSFTADSIWPLYDCQDHLELISLPFSSRQVLEMKALWETKRLEISMPEAVVGIPLEGRVYKDAVFLGPGEMKLNRVVLRHALLKFPKLLLRSDLSTDVVNLDRFGKIEEE